MFMKEVKESLVSDTQQKCCFVDNVVTGNQHYVESFGLTYLESVEFQDLTLKLG
jgi:hypothetical protein